MNKLLKKLDANTYYKVDKDINVIEWCSSCGEEVTINTHYHQQNCPNCGEFIKPCANCIMDNVECHECPLDALNALEEVL